MPSIKGEDGSLDKSSKKSLKKSISKICKYSYRNPYFNFLFEFKSLPENKGLTTKQLFKLAGTKWKELSLEEKQPYIDAAKTEIFPTRKEVIEANRKSGSKSSKVKRTKKNKKDLVRNNKGQFASKGRKNNKNKRMRMSSPVCSNCGHRHGSYDTTDGGGLYDDDDDEDQSDTKSLSSLSVSSDSGTTTKTGTTRTLTKTTAFESDGSSITTF